MTLVMSLPERLSLMLKDCDPRVKAAYHLTQETLDYITRPCFLITIGDEEYIYEQEEQTFVEANFSIDFVGEPFTGADRDYNHHYEIEAREIAKNAFLYLIRRPNLQFSNTLGYEPEELPMLDGVMWGRPQSRSAITLMTRGGIEEGYWGFSYPFRVRSIILENEDEVLIDE